MPLMPMQVQVHHTEQVPLLNTAGRGGARRGGAAGVEVLACPSRSFLLHAGKFNNCTLFPLLPQA